MIYRDNTRVVDIGGVKIGGGNPVRIQSMTNTKTEDVKATTEQILRLEEAGCEIIRSTVPTHEAALAIHEGMTVKQLLNVIHGHPTFSEVFISALEAAEKKLA